MSQIVNALDCMKAAVLTLVRNEVAQDTFEYILIVGAVSVAVILAVLAISPTDLVTAVCGGIGKLGTAFENFSCPPPSPSS